MLFRNKQDGLLIEINRRDYKNDFLYYKKIGEVTGNIPKVFINVNDTPIKCGYSSQAIKRLLDN